MIRKTLFVVAFIAAAVMTALVGLPAGTALVAQETAITEDEAVVAVVPDVMLALGERYDGPLWDLEVQSLAVQTSATRVGWSDVLIGISLRNDDAAPLPYSSTAFFDGVGYPRIALVDAFGVVRPYRMLRPHLDAVPNSNVTQIPPGLAGRWTVGFPVPPTCCRRG